MSSIVKKILDQIPVSQIYQYLSEKEYASKEQPGGSKVGQAAASRKAKNDALATMVKQMAK